MPKETQKRKTPRKRRAIPSLVSLVAHYVHPGYREDYRTLRLSSPDVFDRKYPHTALIPPNPFSIRDNTWKEIARRNGKIPPRIMTVLGRNIGAVEDPEDGKTLVNGPEDPMQILSACFEHQAEGFPPDDEVIDPAIQEIPVWSRIPVENQLPPSGFRRVSLAHLSQKRWLRLEVDLYSPRPTLEKRFRSRVEEYQKLLNLEGRNKDEMLKYLSLFRVTEIAKEKGKPPQVILSPVKFKAGKRTATNMRAWDKAKGDFFRARKQANFIFERIGLPRSKDIS